MPNRLSAVATVQEDNDRVRVTEHRFASGAETTPHVHQWDYVVVPQSDGELLIIEPDVINVGGGELVFIEVDMKAHPIADKM